MVSKEHSCNALCQNAKTKKKTDQQIPQWNKAMAFWMKKSNHYYMAVY